MTILQAIILGIIQGITEFLPVSSSGHLIFLPTLFGWEDQGIAFDVFVHLGSLVAVVFYFREKLWQLIRSFFTIFTKTPSVDYRLAWFIVLSIIPAGVVGLLLKTNTRSALVVGINLIFWGVVLGLADWYQKHREKQGKIGVDVNNMKLWQVAVIAIAQAIALVPGTSRSGITMTAGLFSKLSRKAAAEFSFLMSVPIITLAGLLKIVELVQTGLGDLQISALLVGFISAACSGFLAIAGLMKLIQKSGFMPFVWYRIIIGILVLAVIL